LEVAYNVVEYQWGHAFYVRVPDGLTQWSYVNIHHNVIRGMGTMGLNVSNGSHIYIDDNLIYDTALYPINIEDALVPSTIDHVYIRRNTLDTWCWENAFEGPKGINANSDFVHSFIYIEDNVFTGGYTPSGPPGVAGNDHVMGLIHLHKDAATVRWDNVYVSGNTSDIPKDGVQVYILNTDTLEVTGNQFTGSATALDGGADNPDVMLISTGSTSVTETGNTWL